MSDGLGSRLELGLGGQDGVKKSREVKFRESKSSLAEE